MCYVLFSRFIGKKPRSTYQQWFIVNAAEYFNPKVVVNSTLALRQLTVNHSSAISSAAVHFTVRDLYVLIKGLKITGLILQKRNIILEKEHVVVVRFVIHCLNFSNTRIVTATLENCK